MSRKQVFGRRWQRFVLGLVAVLLIAGVAVGMLTANFGTTYQVSGRPLAAGEAPRPVPSNETEQPQQAEVVPVVVIDSIKQMPYSTVWNPPDGGQDFWQVVDPANGYPESGGTSYVLAHACADRDCVGNELRTLNVGDDLTYLGNAYVVHEKLEIEKNTIAEQDIWHHDANLLVLITCIINTDTGDWDHNDIIVATRQR